MLRILIATNIDILGPESLSNLRVSVPSIVLRGETTSFNCSWDMEPIDKVTQMIITIILTMILLMLMLITISAASSWLCENPWKGVGSEMVPRQFWDLPVHRWRGASHQDLQAGQLWRWRKCTSWSYKNLFVVNIKHSFIFKNIFSNFLRISLVEMLN